MEVIPLPTVFITVNPYQPSIIVQLPNKDWYYQNGEKKYYD